MASGLLRLDDGRSWKDIILALEFDKHTLREYLQIKRGRSDGDHARWIGSPLGDYLRLHADETRLAVMRELLQGPRSLGELNAAIPVEQSLVSHHLRVLRDAGLVETERQGKGVLYRMAPRSGAP